jgi:hypothetical protein
LHECDFLCKINYPNAILKEYLRWSERLLRNQGCWYVRAMARTNMDGKPIRRVLEWLLNRALTDADMAAALDVHPSNYSRHKDDDGYPSFEELATLGEHFHVSPRMLQIAFGLLDSDALILLDEDEMKQYLEQGGGNHMNPTGAGGKIGREKS